MQSAVGFSKTSPVLCQVTLGSGLFLLLSVPFDPFDVDELQKGARTMITKRVAYERTYSLETAPQPKKMNRSKRLDAKKKRGKQAATETSSAVANK